MQRILLLVMVVLGLNACKKDQFDIDQEIIASYVADNNLAAEKTTSGLWYVIEDPGSGDSPTLLDEVSVHYKGYLTDGTIFDQTGSQPAQFPLANVIQGWQEGIPLFKEGGKGLLLIPSSLGYGNRSVGDIPANSVLIFEVELIEVL